MTDSDSCNVVVVMTVLLSHTYDPLMSITSPVVSNKQPVMNNVQDSDE